MSEQKIFLGNLEAEGQQELQVYRHEDLLRWLWSDESGGLWPESLNSSDTSLAKREWRTLPDQIEQFLMFIGRTISSADAEGFVDHALMSSGTLNLSATAFLSIPGTMLARKIVVIDSVAPDAIQAKEQQLDLRGTFFVLSSKSEYELKDHCLFLYFREKLEQVAGTAASNQFVSQTEPDTYLATLSRSYTFRDMRTDPSRVPAVYCSLLQFAALLTGSSSAVVSEVVVAARQIRDACSLVDIAENPALRLAALLSVAVQRGLRYLVFLASPSLLWYTCRLGQLIGTSLAHGDSPLIPLFGAVPRAIEPVVNDSVFVVVSYAGDQDSELDDFVRQLRAGSQPFVHLRLDKPIDLLTETFKWESATILTCARLGTNPFDVRADACHARSCESCWRSFLDGKIRCSGPRESQTS